MTKVEAIERVLLDNGGAGSLSYIYDNIERYYPGAKNPREWEAGIRGVLYRELSKRFKRVGLSLYAVINYKEKECRRIIKFVCILLWKDCALN